MLTFRCSHHKYIHTISIIELSSYLINSRETFVPFQLENLVPYLFKQCHIILNVSCQSYHKSLQQIDCDHLGTVG